MKRAVSIVLSLVMTLLCMGMTALAQEPGEGNTYNGQSITLSDWNNVGEGSWSENDGVISSDGNAEWLLLQFGTQLQGNYVIEYDVQQENIDRNLSILTGFEVNQSENYTTSGLTFEMHNYGLARLYDTAISRQSEQAFGGCNNPYGGMETYGATTEWIHVRIQRVDNAFTVEYYDGTAHMISCVLEDYNGGYLVLGANPYRKISFKNITITDNMTVDVVIDEPAWPEEVGGSVYQLHDNQYQEWTFTTDGWSAEGDSLTQAQPEDAETSAVLESEELRNFRLSFSYELLSENSGTFGVAFRKAKPDGSYKGLGYSLLFRCDETGGVMTLTDYLAAAEAGLDGRGHPFEAEGTVELACSGNEIYVWLDGELVANVTDNAYAFGSLGFFTEGCAVDFSGIQIQSDDLATDQTRDLIGRAQQLASDDADGAAALLEEYAGLSEFQKSFVPKQTLEQLENAQSSAEQPAEQPDETPDAEAATPEQPETAQSPVLWVVIAAVCAAAAVVIILVCRRKKK